MPKKLKELGDKRLTMAGVAAKFKARTKWNPHKNGDVIESAGVEIISDVIDLGPEMRNTHYNIRFMCCGATGRLSHEKIRERTRRHSLLCRSCGAKQTAETRRAARKEIQRRLEAGLPDDEFREIDRGVQEPQNWIAVPWPRPSFSPIGHEIYCDAGAQPEIDVDWLSFLPSGYAHELRYMMRETL